MTTNEIRHNVRLVDQSISAIVRTKTGVTAVPLSPDTYLRVLSDPFTPVRALDGRLLGCVPKVNDDAIMAGQFPLVIAAQVCVRVDLGQPGTPPLDSLPGFIPLDDTNTDLALPAPGTDGDDRDLAEGV